MKGILPNPYYKKMMKCHRIAFTFILTFGLLTIFSPLVAHADLFGYYIPDVYDEITENVMETNDILNKAFKFAQTSPYDVINSIPSTSKNSGTAIAIINASKTMALVVATLLLMVDFVRKSVNFEWSSKWENVLLFLVKILILKQVIQNSDTIIGTIYSMFNSINQAATGAEASFLPYGTPLEYTTVADLNLVREMQKGWWQFFIDLGAGGGTAKYKYYLSLDAVKMFYPNASFPDMKDYSDFDAFTGAFPTPNGKMNFFPTWELTKLHPLFLIMKAIAYIIFVVVIGRVFELTVYTIFAPLPLATFASETSHDVAKSFIKNYIATVIQVAVIAIMFILYSAMNTYIISWMTANHFSSTKLINFVILCVLGLGVVKSGTWSKKICGIG